MTQVSDRAYERLSVLRVLTPALFIAFASGVTIVALAITAPAKPQLLYNAGPVVDYGLPLLKVLANLAAAGTVGGLVLSCFAMDPQARTFGKTLDAAAGCAAAWAVTAAGCAVLTFMSFAGDIAPELFPDALAQFLTDIGLGQAWLATILLSATISVLCFAVRGLTALAAVTTLALVTLVPLALQGHAAGAGGHSAATIAIWLHTAAAATWIGGVVLIAVMHRSADRKSLVTTLTRFSSIALVCFIVVAVSGIVGATLRIEQLGQLFSTAYGLLLTVKICALTGLGIAGFAHRRWLLRKLVDAGGPKLRSLFWRLIGAELFLMGIASGVAVVLARTPPPVSERLATTAAERLTGRPLPAPLSWRTAFDSWTVDPFWLLAVAFGAFFYLAAVHRLRKRGDTWPLLRTVSWISGLVSILYVTNGAPNTYGNYLFSAHMLGHMALGMVIPVLLVLGAPFTLALRTIHPRHDGSRGGREWILLLVHSPLARLITHPVVTAASFGVSLLVFYYTPLFSWALQDPVGHQWMTAHFLIVGFLFSQSLIGIDPVPYRFSYPLRLVTLLAAMAFHAFFGLTLMSATELLLPNWYGVIAGDWGIDPLADQQLAGGIAWSVGEFPTIVLAIALAIAWSRSDTKEARRLDRNADRTNDAELQAYNSMLDGLNSSANARDQ